jgi:regulator of cell morphogenesis and NO signaling
MNPQTTVGQLVVERPARARVFEKFGIDYCCGGKKPLLSVCQEKGLNADDVLGALNVADGAGPSGTEQDWGRATLMELADHIVATHHAYLKAELPRLDHLTERVTRVHGAKHPELEKVRGTFLALKAELEQHMMKEEMILFPLCRQLEAADGPVESHCGSVANPIRVMMLEHDDAGAALATMRTLTGDYVPPEDACNTYRAMLSGLAELEADMHQHVHKENNILFPRAVEREQALTL